jgi:hypothetical protein
MYIHTHTTHYTSTLHTAHTLFVTKEFERIHMRLDHVLHGSEALVVTSGYAMQCEYI